MFGSTKTHWAQNALRYPFTLCFTALLSESSGMHRSAALISFIILLLSPQYLASKVPPYPKRNVTDDPGGAYGNVVIINSCDYDVWGNSVGAWRNDTNTTPPTFQIDAKTQYTEPYRITCMEKDVRDGKKYCDQLHKLPGEGISIKLAKKEEDLNQNKITQLEYNLDLNPERHDTFARLNYDVSLLDCARRDEVKDIQVGGADYQEKISGCPGYQGGLRCGLKTRTNVNQCTVMGSISAPGYTTTTGARRVKRHGTATVNIKATHTSKCVLRTATVYDKWERSHPQTSAYAWAPSQLPTSPMTEPHPTPTETEPEEPECCTVTETITLTTKETYYMTLTHTVPNIHPCGKSTLSKKPRPSPSSSFAAYPTGLASNSPQTSARRSLFTYEPTNSDPGITASESDSASPSSSCTFYGTTSCCWYGSATMNTCFPYPTTTPTISDMDTLPGITDSPTNYSTSDTSELRASATEVPASEGDSSVAPVTDSSTVVSTSDSISLPTSDSSLSPVSETSSLSSESPTNTFWKIVNSVQTITHIKSGIAVSDVMVVSTEDITIDPLSSLSSSASTSTQSSNVKRSVLPHQHKHQNQNTGEKSVTIPGEAGTTKKTLMGTRIVEVTKILTPSVPFARGDISASGNRERHVQVARQSDAGTGLAASVLIDAMRTIPTSMLNSNIIDRFLSTKNLPTSSSAPTTLSSSTSSSSPA
ncbi:hypothetical protein BCR34DRAFT_587643 [Clohesyomyces aquaticus]|uniref:Uncharacterized protein n=1 Tax=Clohesyomyces aquaticus TaxID=1231657 RepID=A0A1Y1ZNH3_9PLEO|nr:hypothetical protein BCR34DRAFT_587643 [Clohesyomyces aquaticus]